MQVVEEDKADRTQKSIQQNIYKYHEIEFPLKVR